MRRPDRRDRRARSDRRGRLDRPSALLALALAHGLLVLGACREAEPPPAATPPASPAPAAAPAPPTPPTPPAPADTPAAAPRAAAVLPDDVPGYPGANAVASSQDGEEGLIVAFQTADDPEKIYQFYKEAFARQGWTLEGEMSSADQRMVLAGKDARRASVMVSVEGEKTEITVTVTKDDG